MGISPNGNGISLTSKNNIGSNPIIPTIFNMTNPFIGGLNGDDFDGPGEGQEEYDDFQQPQPYKIFQQKINRTGSKDKEDNFVALDKSFSKAAKIKETDKAVLIEAVKDGKTLQSWIPKSMFKQNGKKIRIYYKFEPTFKVKDEPVKKEFANDIPPFFPIYQEAVKAKLNVSNIDSHLILPIDKKSTILKDKFVESGGGRNFNTFNQMIESEYKDFYIFYAQFSPWFEKK